MYLCIFSTLQHRFMFHLFFLSVKARTAQLAKIKWFISVAFYILQVSARCRLGLDSCLFPPSAVYVCMCVGVFPRAHAHVCDVHGGRRWMPGVGLLCSPASVWVLGIETARQRALYPLSHLSNPSCEFLRHLCWRPRSLELVYLALP